MVTKRTDRVIRTPESDIKNIREDIMVLNAKKIVNFNFASGDIDKNERSYNVTCEAQNSAFYDDHMYPPALGLPKFREKILGLIEKREGVKLNLEDIAITSGGINGLFLTSLIYVQEGDNVVLPSPYWTPVVNQIIMQGGEARTIDVDEQFDLDVDGIEKAINSKTALIIITSPGNPTGKIYSRDRIKKVQEIAKRNEVKVVYDEAYRDVVFGNEKELLPSLNDELDNGNIVIRTFSKSLSITGWRVGYLLCKDRKFLLKDLDKMLLHTQSGVSTLVQGTLARASYLEYRMERTRSAYRDKRDTLFKWISRINGVDVLNPEGGLFLFADFKKHIPENLSEQENANYIYNVLKSLKIPIFVVPGKSFGESYNNYVRMAYSVESLEKLEQAGSILQEYFGKK